MVLLIYGAGGLAKEIYDVVARSTPDKYEKILFIDDFAEEAPYYLSETIHFTSISEKLDISNLEGIVAVGEPKYRELLAKKFDDLGVKLTTVIDSTALISPTAKINEGAIICEFTTIHANVEIGRGALVQPFCDIGHDISFGDYSVMSPQCAPGGDSIFGKRVYLGMNSSSKEKITVGDDAIVGMGSVVYKDVPMRMTVVGNPARITKGNDEHKVFA